MKRAFLLAALPILAAAPARADEYETAIKAQLTGGLARLAEDGATADTVPAAGFAAQVSYGLRNWIDLDATVAGNALGTAHFNLTEYRVAGTRMEDGTVARNARAVRLTAGATVRGGVAWIPTFSLGAGAQARWRSDVVGTGLTTTPDGYDESITADIIAAGRIGLDHRFGRHWVLGASIGVVHAFPIGAPAFDVVEGALSLSCYWYP